MTAPSLKCRRRLRLPVCLGDEIFLVGPEEQLNPACKQFRVISPKVQVVDAPDTITMEDKGLKLALKAKRRGSQTSMAVGMDLVKNGEADAFVTAGNTGGALATAYYRLGTIPGVERPALTGLFPVQGGHCAVLDIGANPECKPEYLLQFAVMGSIYAEKVRGIQNPRVGLLSNGEEAGKGNELVKGTYPLLEGSRLELYWQRRRQRIVRRPGRCGRHRWLYRQLLLKSSEAVAKLITDVLREQLMSSARVPKWARCWQNQPLARSSACWTRVKLALRLCWGLMGWCLLVMGVGMHAASVSALRTARTGGRKPMLLAPCTHAIQGAAQ